MQRIKAVIKKMEEISEQKDISDIDIDLMLDYTRVVYADLQEIKKKNSFNNMLKRPEQKTEQHIHDTPQVLRDDHIKHQVPEKENIGSDELNTSDTNVNIEDNPLVPVYTNNKDIRTIIGINDKYLFISDLFNDDKAAFDEAIKEINQCNNEEEAIEWINVNLHATYNWSTDNETTQSFYDMVSSFFSDM